MTLRLAVAAVAALAGFALTGCDDDRRAISRDDLPSVQVEPAATVELGDDGFDVATLVVHVDDLIAFVISGDDDHGVRATREPDEDAVIDTGLLHPGEDTIVVFDEAGTYDVVDVTDAEHRLVVTAVDR